MENYIIEEFKFIVSKVRSLGLDIFVWKDTTHVKEGIYKDVDIYVSNFDLFKNILVAEGYFFTINTKAPSGFLFHAYKKVNNELLHLHIYTKLYSGSSWVKQYDFEYYIPELIKTSKENELAIPSDKIILEIEKIRYELKKSTFLDRILLKRSSNKISKEIEKISKNIEIKDEKLDLSNLKLRYSLFTLYTLYIFGFIKRILSGFFGHKLLKGGRVIVIHGSDGSGKSTTIHMLSEYYKGIVKVKKFTTGNLRSSLGITKTSKKKKFKKFKALLIAGIRLFITIKAKLYSLLGLIVFMDRWPTNKINSFDGPRLNNKGLFGKLEFFIYHLIPQPHLAIGLDPGVNKLIERNSLREKEGKETSEEIVDRYELWKHYRVNAKKEIIYKNTNSLDKDFSKINTIIVGEIS